MRLLHHVVVFFVALVHCWPPWMQCLLYVLHAGCMVVGLRIAQHRSYACTGSAKVSALISCDCSTKKKTSEFSCRLPRPGISSPFFLPMPVTVSSAFGLVLTTSSITLSPEEAGACLLMIVVLLFFLLNGWMRKDAQFQFANVCCVTRNV